MIATSSVPGRRRGADDALACGGSRLSGRRSPAGGSGIWVAGARWLGRALRGSLLLAIAHLAGIARAADTPTPKVWQTQVFTLRPGWSAIYSHVDASHVQLDQLTASNTDILEVWRWSPEFSSLQLLESPDAPEASPTNWEVWRRSDPSSTLHYLGGNAAYLVKLRTGSTQLQWSVQGSPVPVFYQWKSDGMNLVGFSTVPTSPPTFESFFDPVPRFLINTPIYQYRGGDLGANNPLQLMTLRTTQVRRGEAFWVRAGDEARFYGRVEFELQDSAGVHFGDRLSRYRLTLRNLASTASTVTASLIASDPAVPAGAEPIVGAPTLLVRGDLNPTTLKHGYQTLTTSVPRSWTLAPRDQPGSELTLILGVHWSQLAGNPGALHGAILRLTENSGHVQYDLPVTARVPDSSGLWVGEATVTHVQQDLKAFRKSSSSGRAVAARTGDVTLTWVRRLPEGATPADAGDTAKWQEVAGLYYRKVTRTYPGVAVGQELPPPPADENGAALADPVFYWQARPVDPSFAAGYSFDPARQVAVANGYSPEPTLIWNRAAGSGAPAGATFPATQTNRYDGALESQVLAPPAKAEAAVTAGYWQARPSGAPLAPEFEYSANTGLVTSRKAGDVTVIWLRQQPESSTPADSADVSKWFESGGQYYRLFSVTYPGVSVGTVLDLPDTDENGGALDDPTGYWEGVPYDPAYLAGHAYDPNTGRVEATGTLVELQLVWLPVGVTDPALGTSVSYTGLTAGTVLAPPVRALVPVAASHWDPRPVGATDTPPFQFTPSGDSYEITGDGKYILTSVDHTMARTAKPMPLRLIVHSAPTGTPGRYAVSLLQRVYLATDSSARLVASILPTYITDRASPVQRISSVHVPWTESNRPTPLTGSLLAGLSGELTTSHADPIANPFVHAYHPDHDNLDARFEQPTPQGVESYAVRRTFTLTPQAEDPDFDSLARGGDSRLGVYEERLRLEGRNGFSKDYFMRGGFLLRRIVKTPTLLTR